MSTRAAGADQSLRLDGMVLERGRTAQTRLRVLELADGSWVELPLLVLRGARPDALLGSGCGRQGSLPGAESRIVLVLAGTRIFSPGRGRLSSSH